jgi:hypothetical protein
MVVLTARKPCRAGFSSVTTRLTADEANTRHCLVVSGEVVRVGDRVRGPPGWQQVTGRAVARRQSKNGDRSQL